MVSIDIYVNETTRHAHVILPPTGPLERDHYDAVFHALAIRNTARFSQAVFPKPEGALHDWEIFAALTDRLLAGKKGVAGLRARVEGPATDRLGPRRIVDLGLRLGPHGGKLVPLRKGLSLGALLENPHGIDLGALVPCLPKALQTADRRVHLAPEIFLADAARLDAILAREADDTPRVDSRTPGAGAALTLIGRRQLRSNNSWMHNSLRLVKGPERCTLKMSLADATARSLQAGERVRVRSRTGTLEVTIDISDEMMPGVVSLPHGWGHDRPGVQLGVATRAPRRERERPDRRSASSIRSPGTPTSRFR